MTVERRRHFYLYPAMPDRKVVDNARQVPFDMPSQRQEIRDHHDPIRSPLDQLFHGAGQIGNAEFQEGALHYRIAGFREHPRKIGGHRPNGLICGFDP